MAIRKRAPDGKVNPCLQWADSLVKQKVKAENLAGKKPGSYFVD